MPRIVGVVGAGTMGAGIAIVNMRAGFRTILVDVDKARIDAVRQKALKFFNRSVALGKLDEKQRDAMLSNLVGSNKLEELACCDLVIEAIFENLEAKSGLLRKLNEICPPETIFGTNTSTLSVTELGAASGRPDRTVGLHFCLPAELMRLVEVTPGLVTSPDTLAFALSYCREAGQVPATTQDQPGFILNTLAIPLNNAAIRLVEAGVASPRAIDAAIKEAYGHKMGPMELLDLVGLDTHILLCEALHGITGEARSFCPPLVRRMVAAGWLGHKAGGGFYQHMPDNLPVPREVSLKIVTAGPSRSFPDFGTAFFRDNPAAPVMLIAGDAAGQAFDALPEKSKQQVILLELGLECLGAHVDEKVAGGPAVIGFARYRLGLEPPTNLVELVVSRNTPEAALAAALGAVKGLGLVPVVCRDAPGRILDRLMRPYFNEALNRLDAGLASAGDIDQTVRMGLGYREGPIELLERVGLDHHFRVAAALYEALADPIYAPAPAARAALARSLTQEGVT